MHIHWNDTMQQPPPPPHSPTPPLPRLQTEWPPFVTLVHVIKDIDILPLQASVPFNRSIKYKSKTDVTCQIMEEGKEEGKERGGWGWRRGHDRNCVAGAMERREGWWGRGEAQCIGYSDSES